jgi:hypothetical protein
LRIGIEIVCQPSHASRIAFGSREVASRSVIWPMSRHSCGFAGSLHHLPLPYVASIAARIDVNSPDAFSSAGVATTSATFSSWSCRRASGETSTLS